MLRFTFVFFFLVEVLITFFVINTLSLEHFSTQTFTLFYFQETYTTQNIYTVLNMNICCIASEMKKKLRFFVCCIYNISREKKYGWNFMLNKTNWNLMVFTSFHISETKEFVQNKFIALLERFQKKKNKIFKFNSMHVLSLSLTIHHGEEKKKSTKSI